MNALLATLFLLGLAIAVAIAAFFLYRGLHNPQKVSWANIAMGISLILLCCGWVTVATINDWGMIAFVQALFASGVAILSGAWLSAILHRWRKIVGLTIAIVVPLAFYVSIEIGFPYSPDSVIRRNGEAIAKSLSNYYADRKTYPQTLNELVPNYLSDIREPKTIWGWLYTANSDDFTLGYVSYIDKMGYSICKYSAKAPRWDCPLDYSTAPFTLAPTPMP